MDREWTDIVDVYSQYFNAHASVNGIERRAVIVKLSALKDTEGIIDYQISAAFFPFRDPEDFLVTGDAIAEKMIFHGKKRRMKKREQLIIEDIQNEINEIITELDPEAVIYWDRPLAEARLG